MIDIHMIDSGKFPENFARQAERVCHPRVRLQVAQPVWGNLAEARRRAYALGDHEFVSWIDDDDEVLDTSWIDDALEILRDVSVSAVYPRWRSTGVLALETPFEPWDLMSAHYYLKPFAHHMTVMRRAHIPQFFDDVNGRPLLRDQDILLVASMARHGRLVAHPAMAYNWVLREGTARSHREPQHLDAWGVAHWRDTVLMHRQRIGA